MALRHKRLGAGKLKKQEEFTNIYIYIDRKDGSRISDQDYQNASNPSSSCEVATDSPSRG